MAQISLLGCGWLGLPLAKNLMTHGFSVKGSTTSVDKIELLRNSKIDPFLVNVSQSEIDGDMNAFLKGSEILIIDIPPKLRGTEKENFALKLKTISSYVEKSDIKKVLFIGATSVYCDDNTVVTDETLPKPDTESGKQLLEAESILKNNPNFLTTILRFGGLIGGERHPIFQLAGRQNLENPDAPINLIHLEDCIGIILKIIENDCWPETLNAAAPFHPTRSEYYTQKAIDLNLPIPHFSKNPSFGKTIDSSKLIELLDYQFVGDYDSC